MGKLQESLIALVSPRKYGQCILLYSVTFRPRSTSVAGTVSNAEGFACCCRAANDDDGYRIGAGQGFELTAVAVGHLGRNSTWR